MFVPQLNYSNVDYVQTHKVAETLKGRLSTLADDAKGHFVHQGKTRRTRDDAQDEQHHHSITARHDDQLSVISTASNSTDLITSLSVSSRHRGYALATVRRTGLLTHLHQYEVYFKHDSLLTCQQQGNNDASSCPQ